jgi:hypothetical protein
VQRDQGSIYKPFYFLFVKKKQSICYAHCDNQFCFDEFRMFFNFLCVMELRFSLILIKFFFLLFNFLFSHYFREMKGVDKKPHLAGKAFRDTSTKNFSRLIVNDDLTFSTSSVAVSDPEALVAAIRDQIIGENMLFVAPFGDRKITYADYTASGNFSFFFFFFFLLFSL